MSLFVVIVVVADLDRKSLEIAKAWLTKSGGSKGLLMLRKAVIVSYCVALKGL